MKNVSVYVDGDSIHTNETEHESVLVAKVFPANVATPKASSHKLEEALALLAGIGVASDCDTKLDDLCRNRLEQAKDLIRAAIEGSN